jgi:type I restriction enzyme M protein
VVVNVTTNDRTFGVPKPEGWPWDTACQIRGPLNAPKFKGYILPLIFLKPGP